MQLKIASGKCYTFCPGLTCVNFLCPSDAIWRHRSGSTLARVMACCLMAPSHYLNQCWLIISQVLWHLPEDNFTQNTQYIHPWYEFENHKFKEIATSPRGQWVNAKEWALEPLLLSLWYIYASKANGTPHLSEHGPSTLHMLRLAYSDITRSISWLLMPWLLLSPSHQQSWYWLCLPCGRIENNWTI